jgi:hypothetical protein
MSQWRKRRSAVRAGDSAGRVRVPLEATVIPLAGVLLLPLTGTLLGIKSSLFPTGLGLAYSASIAAIGAGFAFWQNLHRMPSGWKGVLRVLRPATVAYLLALAAVDGVLLHERGHHEPGSRPLPAVSWLVAWLQTGSTERGSRLSGSQLGTLAPLITFPA